MRISYQWLCDYLPLQLGVDEIAEILTAVGLEVEAVEEFSTVKGGLKNLVIGKVTSCSKHPNADKLNLTTVDIGNGHILPIVCGAPNVAAGQTVVVATVGTMVHPTKGEAFEIKKAKIRGEVSEGMICAEDEIGLGESHDGIIILPDDIQIGTLAKDYYKIPDADFIYEIGLTPNRMDAMSHLGCAKDICAYLSKHRNEKIEVVYPEINFTSSKQPPSIAINIEDQERCKRYAGLELSAVQVSESPEWIQKKLQAIGVKCINNVVDITNFVLHEFGQPLHAFDADKISGKEVIVKTLAAGTKFKTLDEKERSLNSSDLMICNHAEGMCIAGVFGGINSGITTQSSSVFLESANFDPISIRKTSTSHDLRTDASARFEKGCDIDKVIPALQRAAGLLEKYANAQVSSAIQDIYPNPQPKTQIQSSFDFIRELSGNNYTDSDIKNILESLGFEFASINEQQFTVVVPSAKTDISKAADLVEEVMRIDGLNNIPFTGKISYGISAKQNNNSKKYKNAISDYLSSSGMYELFTNSITNSAYFKDQSNLVKMKNNLSSELDSMRPSMLESGLQCIAWNINRKQTDIQFFEFGKVYSNAEKGFDESEKLALFFSGSYLPENHFQKNSEIDFYYTKGKVQHLLQHFGIENNFIADEKGMFIQHKKQKLFELQKVNDERLKLFDIKQDVWYAEADWSTLLHILNKRKISFKEISKFMPARRDLALVLDKTKTFAEINKSVNKLQIGLLRNMNVFDVFESDKIGVDKKSYALSFEFLSNDKTLTDAEIDIEMKKIMDTLSKELGAVVRSS